MAEKDGILGHDRTSAAREALGELRLIADAVATDPQRASAGVGAVSIKARRDNGLGPDGEG